MEITSILVADTVVTDLSATTREEAVRCLVATLAKTRSVDADAALNDIAVAGRMGTTLMPVSPYFVAVPHARTKACKQLVMALGVSRPGVPWDAGDAKRANPVIVILGPPQTHALYLRVISRIARLCETEGFLESILQASSPRDVLDKLAAAEEPLGEMAAGDDMPTFCVLGAGHGGMATAAHLAMTGCKVNLFNRTSAHIEAIRARGGIDVDGEVTGFASLTVISTDPAEAMDDCDVLMVVVPATAHRGIAQIIAPHIKNG